MLKAIVVLKGRVQGVGFRFFVWSKAAEFGVTGTVHNEMDGSVHVHAFGEPHSMERFLQTVRIGPPSSVVESVDVQTVEVDSSPYKDFIIT